MPFYKFKMRNAIGKLQNKKESENSLSALWEIAGFGWVDLDVF